METDFEDAESELAMLDHELDTLFDFPGAWQYYEVSPAAPEVSQAQAPQPSTDAGADRPSEGAEPPVLSRATSGSTPHFWASREDASSPSKATPRSHAVDLVEQIDQFDVGEFNFDLTPRMRLQLMFRNRWGPQHILLKDKLSFLLGCTMLWGCAFWLGHAPESFHKLYTLLGLSLFVIRFFTYRRRALHYYLFDFCYWANLLLLLHLWLWPSSQLLQQTTFAFNTGPLTWTILAFRNSLVFHDLDKVTVTSVYLHLGPAFVSWSYHWYSQGARTEAEGTVSSADGAGLWECYWRQEWRLKSLVLVPMCFYVCWAIMYYLQIFVFSAKKIQQRGYQTLFKYCTTQKRGPFHEITKRVPKRVQPQAYLAMHLAFCFCTLLIAAPCWHFYIAHTLLLVGVTTASIWAGASYYFEVFARRYHGSIEEVVKNIDQKHTTDGATS